MFKGGVWGEGTSNLKVLCFWLREDWDQLFSFLNDFGQVTLQKQGECATSSGLPANSFIASCIVFVASGK